jgi:hypothetical protein
VTGELPQGASAPPWTLCALSRDADIPMNTAVTPAVLLQEWLSRSV